MPNDGVEYETQTVRAVRGMESRTVAKWEARGWEVVSQSQGRLQTEITFRHPKQKTNWRMFAIGGAVIAALLIGIIVNGVIREQNDARAANDPAPVSTEEPADAAPSDEPADDAPTEEPTPSPSSDAADDAALTLETSSELAALLTLTDYCDSSIAAFAESHSGRTISFDGNIGAMNNHEGATTRYDILIGAGDYSETSQPGPSFQFRDVNITNDLHLTGDVPDMIGVGDNLHFTAEIDRYEASSCLLLLEPIQTSVR